MLPIIQQSINHCPKCFRLMEERKHRVITEKILSKSFYFSQWDYCPSCKHVQHYEKYKIKKEKEDL